MSELTALRTLARKKRWSRDDGREVVDAWRAHGGSVAEFARVIGCDYARLRRWSKQLEPTTPTPPTRDPAPRFFEVRPQAEARPLELVVGDIVVRVPPDFDPAALRRLLTTLDPC